MHIMVFDVPASGGGALSVLQDFYEEVRSHPDKNIQWTFVLSVPILEETENIRILRFPWVKKSWFHRLFFDCLVAPVLAKQYKVDIIFSLQNIIIPFTKVQQILYMHQSLPFAEKKYSLTQHSKYWIIQNIIGRLIIWSMKRAKLVVVQGEWLRKICVVKANISQSKIAVVPPVPAGMAEERFIPNKKNMATFFYPAGAMLYKNHEIIVAACQGLVERGRSDFRVVFTLHGTENALARGLFKKATGNDLPIDFVGQLSRQEVFEFYTKSILVFPSYIETFGLPLLEALLHGAVIFASDCPFSREIVRGYENAYLFNPSDAGELTGLMEYALSLNLSYHRPRNHIGIGQKSLVSILTGERTT